MFSFDKDNLRDKLRYGIAWVKGFCRERGSRLKSKHTFNGEVGVGLWELAKLLRETETLTCGRSTACINIFCGDYLIVVWVNNNPYSDLDITFAVKTDRIQLYGHIDMLASLPRPARYELRKFTEGINDMDALCHTEIMNYKSIPPNKVTPELINEIVAEIKLGSL